MHAPLPNLEEVFDPSLICHLLFYPFLAPHNHSVSDLTLLFLSPPFSSVMELEIGEISRGDASALEDASLILSEEPVLVEPCLEKAPFKELCGEIVMGSASSSIGLIDSICTGQLDLTTTSSLLLSTTSSHLHAFHESLGDIKGSHPTFDPYYAYLEDVPRKIM